MVPPGQPGHDDLGAHCTGPALSGHHHRPAEPPAVFLPQPRGIAHLPGSYRQKKHPQPSRQLDHCAEGREPGRAFRRPLDVPECSLAWGGYGIHGTNNPRSIGRMASHGCIRMYNRDVIAIYDQTPLGTPVYIIGESLTGRLLQQGARGEDVSIVQRRLRTLGYYRYRIDRYFGPRMHESVVRFQQANNLAADGIVGPDTYVAIQKALDMRSNDTEP